VKVVKLKVTVIMLLASLTLAAAWVVSTRYSPGGGCGFEYIL